MEEIDDAVLAILAALHDVAAAASEQANDGLSLAKLSKRVALRMSTLRRQLTALESADIVTVSLNEDGTGRAALTPAGIALCDALAEVQHKSQ
ncbi:helix-turn-helix domain-containing protein [Paraherbaspirillum soli]|uniref:Helix-turn-helix domain-containing protein n=1 Tax=Paraherbaspirillum soli TaxID=631222 RepID=A0ABW0M7I0_9BURK